MAVQEVRGKTNESEKQLTSAVKLVEVLGMIIVKIIYVFFDNLYLQVKQRPKLS